MKKTSRPTVEIKESEGTLQELKSNCIVCGKKLRIISGLTSSNAEDIPSIDGGVVFRSSGQYGSTVLDCGEGIPYPWGTEVQIIVCDKCLMKKSKIINATKNKRGVIVRYPAGDRAAQWSDYGTFAELIKDMTAHGDTRYKLFTKMMKNHESRKIEKGKKVIRDYQSKKVKK